MSPIGRGRDIAKIESKQSIGRDGTPRVKMLNSTVNVLEYGDLKKND